MQNLDEAYRMLDAFASVGARHFDVTFLDVEGKKRGFRKGQSLAQLRNSLPLLMPGLTERQNSIVVRAHAEDVTLVQLDDLNADATERLKDVAFLMLQTSPGNYQAWVAMSGAQHKDLARRLRKGTGADISASGAVRVAGTVNYKAKYSPDFPTVTVLAAFPGRMIMSEQLEELGLLASPEPVRAITLRVSPASSPRSWPNYERCVQGAPMNHAGTAPDISRADFMWSLMAAQRGHAAEDIAARLMEVSAKAKENGEQYARLTAESASAATVRQRTRE